MKPFAFNARWNCAMAFLIATTAFIAPSIAADGFGEKSAVKVSAFFSPKQAKPGDTVTFSVQLKLPAGYHTYPQKTKAGLPTKLTVRSVSGVEAIDKAFTPTTKPKLHLDPDTGETYDVFEGTVTWVRKFRVIKSAKNIAVNGAVRYQVCTGTICKQPKTVKVAASGTVTGNRTTASNGDGPIGVVSLTRESAKSNSDAETTKSKGKAGLPKKKPSANVFPFISKITPVRGSKELAKPDPVDLKFELTPRDAKAGDTVRLNITANFRDDWHGYALTHEGKTGLPVGIKIKTLQGLEPIGKGWRPNVAPDFKTDDSELGNPDLQEHHGVVVWSREFKVTAGTESGAYGATGSMRYQVCKAVCLQPKTVPFALGDVTAAKKAPDKANDIDRSPFDSSKVVSPENELNATNLAWYLLAAFLGGLILNVMPCVLPVIAIKVMSFVQQAGENRSRIFMLNSVYALGVVSVFLLLATLAVSFNVGWGGLFKSAEFTLVMGAFVFAMGLSLLGVFEIPLPGFLGSAAGGQHQEGPAGAFLTGVFATILATPCSGPFLGVTFVWSVQQPPAITFLVWGVMGLGMAFPYLVFAMYPKASRLLPKPGDWMVRFKEISGFVLMGTTVWIIHSLSRGELIYTLIGMTGIGFSLWMIGHLYNLNSSAGQKWTIRLLALTITMFAVVGGTWVLDESTLEKSEALSFLRQPDSLAVVTPSLSVMLAIVIFRATSAHGVLPARRRVFQAIAVLIIGGGSYGAYFVNSFAELPWEPYSEKSYKAAIANGNVVLIDFTADW